MTQEKWTAAQIAEVLEKHRNWLYGEAGGICANLSSADLRSANLYGANLYGADLRSANLRSANLRSANLRSANLYGANLSSADLRSANLRSANLYGADLRSANLYGANLSSANLYGADLRSANLYGANLSSANLYGANLYGANLYGAKNVDVKHYVRRQIVPESGAFEAWKKLKGGAICKLRIPAEAARVGGVIGRKCRAEFAEVLEGAGVSDRKLTYTPGQIVKPDKWDADPTVECSHGIHFFITRLEAEEYEP